MILYVHSLDIIQELKIDYILFSYIRLVSFHGGQPINSSSNVAKKVQRPLEDTDLITHVET